MAQQTLEEAALKLYPLSAIPRKLFIRGAKWQQAQDKEMHKSECINFAEQWELRCNEKNMDSKEQLYDEIYKK